MTKVETMDQNVEQLTSSNTVMEASIQTLHEGQLSMVNHIKMLMLKLVIQTDCQPKNTAKTKKTQEPLLNKRQMSPTHGSI